MAKLSKAEQAAAELRHRRYTFAGKVGERFPAVASITLQQTWHDPDYPKDDPTTKTARRGPDGSAFFELACANRECVGGGIDLAEEIQNMVSSGETSRTGRRRCEGWQDAERVNKHRCWMELEYTIDIDYRSEEAP